jgi:two-component system OmpR family response regulator
MRVLLVEDEERLASVVQDGLQEHGFVVDVEHDGESGLWRAREGSYDVIVLDIMLPGMDGDQICRTLRDEKDWTPILMLTARDGERDEAEALDIGADDFLTKPFSFLVLMARLRALARRISTVRPAVLTCGSLELDPASSSVRRGDRDVELSRRELDVLETLMRAEERPVPKQILLDRVWGIDAEVDPNIVEVYIHYLRSKLDEPFGLHTILTQRGIGYRIVADEQ